MYKTENEKMKKSTKIPNEIIVKRHFNFNKKQIMSNNISISEILEEKAFVYKTPLNSKEFAKRLDENDSLSGFRDLFCIPKKIDLPKSDINYITDESDEGIYLCGHSLGLKPKSVDKYIQAILNDWGKVGVHHHFKSFLPAAFCDLPLKANMAKIVGANENEVAIMNGLTVNLHLLLSTFYNPTERRHKIMIEDNAFPSDMYAVKSQIVHRGYSVNSSLLTIKPRSGEELFREEDIIKLIEKEGDSVSLILLFSVHYYTGQLMNIEKLTTAAHAKGIIVGIDCAHAAGNVILRLHDWNVDFACWCTYKYLNSGAGCLACIFVHERIFEINNNKHVPAFKGWWGNNIDSKFLMRDEFSPAPGADMFKLSNPSPLLAASLMASLDIFALTSMEEIVKKQQLLTGFFELLMIKAFPKFNRNIRSNKPSVEILTPSDPNKRGAQLSVRFNLPLTTVLHELERRGVTCDIRKPNVLRVAPAPLYNTFQDVYDFVEILKEIFYGKTVEDFIEVENDMHSKIPQTNIITMLDECENELISDSNTL